MSTEIKEKQIIIGKLSHIIEQMAVLWWNETGDRFFFLFSSTEAMTKIITRIILPDSRFYRFYSCNVNIYF